MPLEALLPQIDDRSYDDIVAEIRTRISRYAPEWQPGDSAWTDVNDNDPGVTLAQVFAWLAEMLIYRMNLVPQLNYIKFLELIGIELQPAVPAQAEVTFPVLATAAQSIVPIPMGTQLTADPQDGNPPLTFQTTAGINALRAQLNQLLTAQGGGGYAEITDLNSDGTQTFEPFGPDGLAGSEIALGFVDSASIPEAVLDLAFVVASNPQAGGWYACGDVTIVPATLAWEYWGSSGWTSLNVLKDDTLAFSRSGHVLLRLPAGGLTQTAILSGDPTDTTQRYWIRARVVTSEYEVGPQLNAIRTNTAAVIQAQTILNEVLGGSDGSRNQVFQLANTPVVAGSLVLQIQQTEGAPDTWTEVPDFFESGPDDEVYVLNRTTGQITTGDGVNGAVPAAYVPNLSANVVAVTYQIGGGARGNVAAGLISSMSTPITGIDAGNVGNLLAASGGSDEESLADATERAPLVLKSKDRAITNEDFETLATQAGGVARAKALPLYNPQFPDMSCPGTVSVIIVPNTSDPAPQPTDALLASVCAYLDARRLLACELFILRPLYQQVSIQADIDVVDTADLAQATLDVEAALLAYFHPLTGGDQGTGWPFGGTIYFSRVFQQIFDVDNGSVIADINSVVILLNGVPQPQCTNVAIPANALVYSTEHTITASYSSGNGS
jgi:predicted phage baseplate assembly protein